MGLLKFYCTALAGIAALMAAFIVLMAGSAWFMGFVFKLVGIL
jgi:hypothetical protein